MAGRDRCAAWKLHGWLRLLCGAALCVITTRAPAAEPAGADEPFHVQAHYTKYEFQVPMRDGVRLLTSVYVPKDASKPYPILLGRTPYGIGPYGVDNFRASIGPSEHFAKGGYIIALQDVRGRMKSEGVYAHVRPPRSMGRGPRDADESTDTWDTIDWLVKNVPGNNGRVGLTGISYPGFYTSLGMMDAHPALKAASPQAPIADWFVGDDFHHNGCFFLAHAFGFFYGFAKSRPPTPLRVNERIDYGTADGYEFFLALGPLANANARFYHDAEPFWNEMMEHDTYDAFWKARDLRPHLKNIRPAVMTVGGWFDAEDLFGTLATYRAVERTSGRNQNILVMGPWPHGGWRGTAGDSLGRVRFDAKTAEFYRKEIELAFFDYHLKGGADPRLPEAYVFETGRNQWRKHDAWPPRGASPRTLYLQADGKLSFDRPADEGYDEYVSDPRKPVPFIEEVSTGMAVEYMVADQRFASRRPDVLVYQTEPLEADVTIAGPFAASLRVSTTGTDADFVVKLIDVYPPEYPDQPPPAMPSGSPTPTPPRFLPGYPKMGGYQQLVRGEPFRGKFRKGFDRPLAFAPGEPDQVEFPLPDIYHTFRRGHRIMVQVQSTWFPLVDLNPQTFTQIYQARPEQFTKATQRVYRGGAAGSHLRVLVMP